MSTLDQNQQRKEDNSYEPIGEQEGVWSGVSWTKNKQVMMISARCFSAFPDYEMFEIGVECAATLTKLDDSGT